ncbi:MAG: hypothetical protein HC773_00930 [Scytonema sp. CRU_2_7]|nr:hypothetical protein [Scytonema sp. CRU_2_7]
MDINSFDFLDDELEQKYTQILDRIKAKEDAQLSLSEEIALLSAMLNTLTRNSEFLAYDARVLDIIKLKAVLVKEERQQRERIYKEEINKARVKMIPLESFQSTAMTLISRVSKYVSNEQLAELCGELSEMMRDLEDSI